MRVLSIVVLCAVAVALSNGSKILGIFPLPIKSHYILGEALMRGLAQRGHEITMISPFSLDKPMNNYTDVIMNGMHEVKETFLPKFTSVNTTLLEKIQIIAEDFPALYNAAHNCSNVREFLQKSEKFDLCIVAYTISESLFGICNAVEAPAIGFMNQVLSSFVTYHTNNPVTYSYIPSPWTSYSQDMTFFQRIHNLAAWYFMDGLMHFISMPYQAKVLKTYHPNAPSMDEIMDKVDLYFLNTHISTDFPKPLLPNIIPIGGFHLEVLDEIPKDIKKFLDDSKKGVIYFSLGSNAKSSDLQPAALDSIIKALAKSNFDVLWKFEADLPNKPKNIHIANWIPQRPILRHPNVKMFITHGGLSGTAESIYSGIPMICIPMFADQPKNCANSQSQGYAITIDIKTITEERLTNAIKEIGTNPSYKEKILLKSDLYRNQEINPMDRAIFWAEHVIRHKGAKHLKSRAANIPWYQYHLLDVLSFLGVVIVVLLCIIYSVVKISLKILCSFTLFVLIKTTDVKVINKKKKKDKKQKIQ